MVYIHRVFRVSGEDLRVVPSVPCNVPSVFLEFLSVGWVGGDLGAPIPGNPWGPIDSKGCTFRGWKNSSHTGKISQDTSCIMCVIGSMNVQSIQIVCISKIVGV